MRVWVLLTFFASVCARGMVCEGFTLLTPGLKKAYERYLEDTYRGLNAMRGDNGLVMDTVHVKQDGKGGFTLLPYKTGAAPTDIGFDLLAQVGMTRYPKFEAEAQRNLGRVLDALEKLPRHSGTGLFYRLYETKGAGAGKVLDADLSSVDNIHLALGLWTLAETMGDQPIGQRARKLFDGMDFSRFYDPDTGLVGGNLKAPEHKLEPYRYHFGSEARSVYLLGYALGLFKQYPPLTLKQSLDHVPIEVADDSRGHLQVWDGGVFQSQLPRMLLNEDWYSLAAHRNGRSVAGYMEFGGQVVGQGDQALRIPAGCSACVSDVRSGPDGVEVVYTGKAGLKRLKSPGNDDEIDGGLVATHAVLLGATVRPARFSTYLAGTETLQHQGQHYYLPGFGWVDSGRMVNGADGKSAFRPNSAGVGVDKGIEMLALLEILDPERRSVSGNALMRNSQANLRLTEAFWKIDARWRRAPAH